MIKFPPFSLTLKNFFCISDRFLAYDNPERLPRLCGSDWGWKTICKHKQNANFQIALVSAKWVMEHHENFTGQFCTASADDF